MHAGLSGDDCAVADIQMPSRANLSREDYAISYTRGSGQSDLSADNGVFSHFAGMADQHQIVNFCAAADARFADGGAVDAGIGLDLDVILDHHRSILLDLVPTAV